MESSCYLLKDEHGIDRALFTGDTLFVGDVGRPDLAQALDAQLTPQKLAGLLYDSLQNKILPLHSSLMVYPGHGAPVNIMSSNQEKKYIWQLPYLS